MIPRPMPVCDSYRPSRIVDRFANPGAVVGHFDNEQLRRGAPFHRVLDSAAARVVESVAGNLGNRGRDAGLILRVEAQQPGDLPGALAGVHRIVLVANVSGKDRPDSLR